VKLDRVDFNNRLAFPKHARNTARPGEEADQGSAETDGFDAEGVSFDLIVGCDGSWSKVRQEMMRVQR
jgi:kynurenine 3-monooxygenase